MITLDIGPRSYPLGGRPRTLAAGERYPTLDRVIPLLDEASWHDLDYSHLLWHLHDQDGIGSCNACAATLALEGSREFAGQDRVQLSPGCLYGQICGGRDEGSQLADALQALRNVGTVPASVIPPLVWQQDRWPPTWRDIAAEYRLDEVYDCPTLPHIVTALHYAWYVDLGIPVHANFEPDADGIIPPPRGALLGYHAMAGYGYRKIGTRHYVGCKNSWGPWGPNNSGRCWIPQDYLDGCCTDAWCVRVARYSLP